MKANYIYLGIGLLVLLSVASFLIGAAIGLASNSDTPVAQAESARSANGSTDRDPEPGSAALVGEEASTPVGTATQTDNAQSDNAQSESAQSRTPPDDLPATAQTAQTPGAENGGDTLEIAGAEQNEPAARGNSTMPAGNGQSGAPVPGNPAPGSQSGAMQPADSGNQSTVFGKEIVETITGRVTRVRDGDTIELETEDGEVLSVNIDSIDAPEWKQEHGPESQRALRAVIFEKQVNVLKTGEDNYGRTLGFIMIDGRNMAAFMIRNGNAWHYSRFSNDLALADLQREAEEQGRGLWGLEGTPLAPWQWRRQNNNN
ncbi:MAG: thermonuclease family protein [Planctomycetota bacterium]